MNAVLFVGHGSRDPHGNDEVRAFVQSVIETLDQPIAETCFLEFEKPNIAGGIDICIQKGATRVVVIPIILFAAGHAKIHIPAAIDEAKLKYPLVQFIYGRPIGIHDKVLDILTSRTSGVGIGKDEELEDTAILVVGRGSSDPDANSDLFKISRLLWEKMKVKWVETAFIGVTSPLIEEGMEKCLKLGARHVVIVPYFLFTGILINRMDHILDEFKLKHPHHQFSMAEYFGFHPILKQILKDRVNEAVRDEVKVNCDMCHYRIAAMDGIEHHHHHDHDHDHHAHDHDHDHHDHDHDHDHHDHDHKKESVTAQAK
ncbi:sirohydrochlorin chelatase [Cohnella sp.]|uniref:sirohydrochlorin chelatase n=1 Tax=Cohnella sp. TaxID=1883426 RepID=UPI00356984A6